MDIRSPSIDTRSALHVVYFGTYRAKYSRNQIFIEGLRRNRVTVTECHEALWESVEDRVKTAKGGWAHPRFWWRVLRAYWVLTLKFMRLKRFDILFVGYPGHYDVFLARLLAWVRGVPLVWDVFNSLFLIVSERGIDRDHPFTVRMIRSLEKIACRLPDMLILDNQLFIDWFCLTHKLKPDRFRVVPIVADDRNFKPIETSINGGGKFNVIFYGTYIPNHGVDTIVHTAKLLQDDPEIHFEMVGIGPERDQAVRLARELQLKNITFYDWIEPTELAKLIARAEVVLGAFGTTRQLELTNNTKIYEGFAMQKAVVSGASPAIPQPVENEVHLLLCRRGDPQSLAESILRLKADPDLRKRLAQAGNALFKRQFNPTPVGAQLRAYLEELVG